MTIREKDWNNTSTVHQTIELELNEAIRVNLHGNKI